MTTLTGNLKFLRLEPFTKLSLFIALCVLSCKSTSEPPLIEHNNESVLLWEENFNGNELDLNTWNFELGNGCPKLCGWGNNEPQFYTDTNHVVKDGFLTITAKYLNDTITSARITTKKKIEQKYGRIVCKAKLPVGKGVWPAFWMLGSNITEVGWPLCGEIDVMEYVGREPGRVFNSLHTAYSHGETINTKKTAIPNIEEDFHVYEANWTDKNIEFYVDQKLLYTFTPDAYNQEQWPFNQPFYFILNMAVGGNFGGHDIDYELFPAKFTIDYIKVYANSSTD